MHSHSDSFMARKKSKTNPTVKKPRCQAQKMYHSIGMSRQPVLTDSRLSWPIEHLINKVSSCLWLDEPLHPEQAGEDFACCTAWTQVSQNVTGIKPCTKLEALRERCFRGECSQQPKDMNSTIQVSFSQERFKFHVLTSLRLSYPEH